MKRIFVIALFLVSCLMAAEAVPANSEVVAPVSSEGAVAELQAEIALRDSVMAVQDSLNRVEKDSLRSALKVERAKSENWEQSYQTLKKGNEVCAQALNVSLEVNEKNKNAVEEERKKASIMGSSSFFGGLALGMLLFWLIFD